MSAGRAYAVLLFLAGDAEAREKALREGGGAVRLTGYFLRPRGPSPPSDEPSLDPPNKTRS